jgi:hypothetical protein
MIDATDLATAGIKAALWRILYIRENKSAMSIVRKERGIDPRHDNLD